MGLLDILQGVGNILDTPGSVVRGALSGQFDRVFGGIFDPSQRVSGRDLLNSYGIDGGELGGLAAGIATDPLVWGGGALLRLLGKGGEAAAAAGRAAGLGEEATAAGAKSLAEAGGQKFTQAELTAMAENPAMRATGEVGNSMKAAPGVGGYYHDPVEGWVRTAAMPAEGGSAVLPGGAANTVGGAKGLTEAEQWMGAGRMEPTSHYSPGAGGYVDGPKYSAGAPMMDSRLNPGVAAGDVSPLLNLRRDFSVLKNAGLDVANQPTFRAVGGLDAAGGGINRARSIMEGGQSALESALSDGGEGMQGLYSPVTRTATIMEGASPGTARHEIMHGLIDAAMRSGDASGLAFVPRAAVRLQQANSPLLNGLGQIAEEAAAYGSEGRGISAQLGNILKFLDNPTPGYTSQFAGTSPLVAYLYRSFPYAWRGAAAGGAGLGAYAGSNALLGDGE